MENQSQICNFVITNFFLICNTCTWKIRQFVIKNSFKYNDYIVKPCTLKTNFLLVVVHQHAEGQGTMIYMDQNVKKQQKTNTSLWVQICTDNSRGSLRWRTLEWNNKDAHDEIHDIIDDQKK